MNDITPDLCRYLGTTPRGLVWRARFVALMMTFIATVTIVGYV